MQSNNKYFEKLLQTTQYNLTSYRAFKEDVRGKEVKFCLQIFKKMELTEKSKEFQKIKNAMKD